MHRKGFKQSNQITPSQCIKAQFSNGEILDIAETLNCITLTEKIVISNMYMTHLHAWMIWEERTQKQWWKLVQKNVLSTTDHQTILASNQDVVHHLKPSLIEHHLQSSDRQFQHHYHKKYTISNPAPNFITILQTKFTKETCTQSPTYFTTYLSTE